MVLTNENAGALVPGVILKEENVETKRVKVLRGFFDGKNRLKPGDIVTLSASLAHQAKDAGKVEFLPEEPKASPAKPPSIPLNESKSEAEAEPRPQVKEKSKKF
jgi:hypothetical protein